MVQIAITVIRILPGTFGSNDRIRTGASFGFHSATGKQLTNRFQLD